MTASLYDIIAGAWLSKSLAVAARLGVADSLKDGPRTCDQIAAETGADSGVLLRLLRLLAAHQVFERCEDGSFRNSPLSESLRSDHELSLRHFSMLAGEEYYDAWGGLLHSVRTGGTAFAQVFGGSIYDHMDAHPEAARVYDLAMRDLARPVGYLLARGRAFPESGVIVDVGGGSGELLGQVLAVHGKARGICVDRPDVCARARPTDRLSFQPGDFFQDIPARGQVFILKNVLHNWNDESGAAILASVAAAMRASPGADGEPVRLLVIEPLVEPDSTAPRALMNALFQIVVCQDGVRERSAADLAALLARAGLAVAGAQVLASGHTVTDCVLAA